MYQYLLIYIYSTNLKCKATQTRKTIKIIDANQNRREPNSWLFVFLGFPSVWFGPIGNQKGVPAARKRNLGGPCDFEDLKPGVPECPLVYCGFLSVWTVSACKSWLSSCDLFPSKTFELVKRKPPPCLLCRSLQCVIPSGTRGTNLGCYWIDRTVFELSPDLQ